MITLKISKNKKYLMVLPGIIMLLALIARDAHSGCGGCGQNSSYGYGSYLDYSWYNPSAGRSGSVLGSYGYSPYYPAYSNVYPVYSNTYPVYSNTYSAYPTIVNSVLPSTYSSGYNLNQPYVYGNTFTLPYNNYASGGVTSKNYTVEQSRTTYVPGGEVTTTVSEGTGVSLLPQYNSFYTPYNSYPYTIGSGNWMNLAGLGMY